MKYLLTFGGDPITLGAPSGLADERIQAEIDQWWTHYRTAGKILTGVRLKPPSTATTLRFANRPPLIWDGPCTPEPEAIGGYSVIDVDDLDEALALVRAWPGSGYVEIRPILQLSTGDQR